MTIKFNDYEIFIPQSELSNAEYIKQLINTMGLNVKDRVNFIRKIYS